MFVVAISGVPGPNFTTSNLMSLSKASVEDNRNVSMNFFAAAIENENKTIAVSGEKIWKKHGFFNAMKPDFNAKKVNYPENTLFHINQGYLTVKKNKKTFCCDYFNLGRVIESSNLPENISSYTVKENKVRIMRP